MIIDKDKYPTEVDHKREEMSKKRHISFWLTEEDMNGYQCQILMPVIFCKDCKHWTQQLGNYKGDAYGCCGRLTTRPYDFDMTADDFCSRGVKK